MPELKPISPLLDGMEIVRRVAASGGTALYLLRHRASGEAFMLKHISIPESQTQVEALMLTGGAADEAEAQKYYEQIVADYEDRLTALASLKGSSNCATYLGYQVCPREEGVGFELYLLSERYVTLPDYLHDNAMTHLRALNLGLDLCTALCELRRKELIHRDVKPENVYLNALGGFMIGDLGVARISELKFCPMPDRMISEYTAPEIADAIGDFNTTVDIYSAGMVLYRILNGNHGPFEDENTSAKAANKLRVGGEPLPSPLYADYELAAIVLKACAFEPADRYQTPEEMLQDLVLYMKRNDVNDSLIVPPIIGIEDEPVPLASMDEPVEPVRFTEVEKLDEKFVDSFSPDLAVPGLGDDKPGPVFAAPHAKHVADDEPEPVQGSGKERPRRGRIIVPILIALLLTGAAAAGVCFLLFGGPSVAIAGVTVSERGVDFLEVSIDDGGSGAELRLECLDAYGKAVGGQAAWLGEPVTFSGLGPGAQYTIRVSSPTGRRLTGVTSATASTVAVTEIVDFTAESNQTGQVDLKLTVSGPDPGEWTVWYSADGGEARSIKFRGHEVSVFNLEPGKKYTFSIEDPEGLVLRGASTAEFTTPPDVEIFDLSVQATSGSTAKATWRSGDSKPPEWSVTITGPDGTSKTQFVKLCEASFTQLVSGGTYTVTVTAPGAAQAATATVTPIAAKVSAVHAEAAGADAIRVSWETDQPHGEWLLRYAPKGSSASEVVTVRGSETTLNDLAPGASYEFELRSAKDETLGENAKAGASLPEPEAFDAYGADRFFMGSFLLPEKANWSRMDLSPGVTEFKPDQGIAIAADSFSGHEDSEDEVKVTIVLEDRKGVPVRVKSYSEIWDELWSSGVIIGVLEDLPAEPGDYVIRLYLNAQTVAAREIEILAE